MKTFKNKFVLNLMLFNLIKIVSILRACFETVSRKKKKNPIAFALCLQAIKSGTSLVIHKNFSRATKHRYVFHFSKTNYLFLSCLRRQPRIRPWQFNKISSCLCIVERTWYPSMFRDVQDRQRWRKEILNALVCLIWII